MADEPPGSAHAKEVEPPGYTNTGYRPTDDVDDSFSERRRTSTLTALKDERDPEKRAERLKWKQCAILQGFTEKKYLLYPKTPFMQRWDTTLGVLLVYTAFITPYEVAFLATQIDNRSGITMFTINRLVDLFFFTDLFFNFNLAYFDSSVGSGMWVMDRRKIVKRYLTSFFLVDVFSTMPFGMIVLFAGSEQLEQVKVLRVIRLLRLAKLLRILRTGRLLRRIEQSGVSYNVLTLCKFVVGVLTIAHWLACGFNLVVRIEEDPELNWVDRYFSNFQDVELKPPSNAEVYIAAFYWALVTMTTIGYGDISPATTAERFYEIFAMLIGTSVFAYVVGSLVTIVSNMDRKSNQFYELMDTLNGFMEELNFSEDLRKKVRNFFRFQRNSSNVAEYRHLLARMSPAIRGEVAGQQCGKWLSTIPFFHKAPIEFVQEIAQCLDVETFPQSEVIQAEGEYCEKMYIVQRGLVGGKGRVYNTGKVFGEILAGTGVNTYTARALTFTDVYTLTRTDLEKICENFPVMMQRLRNMGLRQASKAAILNFTNSWKRLKRGMGLPTVDQPDENMPFMTPAKLSLHWSQKALKIFVDHVASLDPTSRKPKFSVAARLLKSHGVDIKHDTAKDLRGLCGGAMNTGDLIAASVLNAAASQLNSPARKRRLSNTAPLDVPRGETPPPVTETTVALGQQLSAIQELIKCNHSENDIVRETLVDISKRLAVLEAAVQKQ